ncbi:hypothetical protein AJ80_01949 [Polytolypa hystricis UAMH7299]|uniref:NACHT domain-containing protein n=1 Tax=Polytolypa hystricis (strain UAMH7299) TaxID=1447883 RepID=A0A2B7YZ77_POLH7|nr:hypothetical protein AJ80_01949 [Polytolypa hystricis UAMH7299]
MPVTLGECEIAEIHEAEKLPSRDIDPAVFAILSKGSRIELVTTVGASHWAAFKKVGMRVAGEENEEGVSYFLKVYSGGLGQRMALAEFNGAVAVGSILPENTAKVIGWGTYTTTPDKHFILASYHNNIIEKVIPRLLRPLETGGRHINRVFCMEISGMGMLALSTISPFSSTFAHFMDTMNRAPRYETRKGCREAYASVVQGDTALEDPNGESEDRNILYAATYDLSIARVWASKETRKENKRVLLLNADHRAICRFTSPVDPNYQTVRNALVLTVTDLLRDGSGSNSNVKRTGSNSKNAELQSLAAYLAASESYIDDLLDLEELQTAETCHWFVEEESFQSWINPATGQRQLFWLTAKPGSGKSVMAGYVVRYLQREKLDCSYYFFNMGNKINRVSSSFLLSLAYQLAVLIPDVRCTLVSMQEDKIQLDRDDDRAIWRKIFLGRIFRLKISRPQYCVIDAMDECVNTPNLLSILSRIESEFPIHFLVTSREIFEFQRYFEGRNHRFTIHNISVDDSMQDIRRYLDKETKYHHVDSKRRQALISKIIDKASGSFLWVRLVLQEIATVFSEEQIDIILDEVPVEMELFYTRGLQMMSKNIREKWLVCGILIWVVCASRPLKTAELQAALRYDFEKTIYPLNRSVEVLCGHLVYLNKSRTFEIVQATARDFF